MKFVQLQKLLLDRVAFFDSTDIKEIKSTIFFKRIMKSLYYIKIRLKLL